MQRHHFKSNTSHLNMVSHKRVFSEMNSMQCKSYFDINAQMVQSIKQPTFSGIQLLSDFMKMKQILHLKQVFEMLLSLKPCLDGFSFRKNLIKNQSKGNLHQRIDTVESQINLERANLITQIISKLHTKDTKKDDQSRQQSPRLPFQSSMKRRQRTLTNKLMNTSTNQSNFHKQHSFIPRFHTKQSSAQLEISQLDFKPNKLSNNNSQNSQNNDPMFKRLRNQITKVKQQVSQLQIMNQQYRRQNQMLRLKSAERDFQPLHACCCHRYIISQCNHMHSHKLLNKKRNLSYLDTSRQRKCYNCGSDQVF